MNAFTIMTVTFVLVSMISCAATYQLGYEQAKSNLHPLQFVLPFNSSDTCWYGVYQDISSGTSYKHMVPVYNITDYESTGTNMTNCQYIQSICGTKHTSMEFCAWKLDKIRNTMGCLCS